MPSRVHPSTCLHSTQNGHDESSPGRCRMSPDPFQWPKTGMIAVDCRRNGRCSIGVFGLSFGNSQTDRTRQIAFS